MGTYYCFSCSGKMFSPSTRRLYFCFTFTVCLEGSARYLINLQTDLHYVLSTKYCCSDDKTYYFVDKTKYNRNNQFVLVVIWIFRKLAIISHEVLQIFILRDQSSTPGSRDDTWASSIHWRSLWDGVEISDTPKVNIVNVCSTERFLKHKLLLWEWPVQLQSVTCCRLL